MRSIFFFSFNFTLYYGWLVRLEIPVYLCKERILQPNFYELILGKINETMQVNSYAVTALVTAKVTKIFLTVLYYPASCQIKNICRHARLTTFPKFEELYHEIFRNRIHFALFQLIV